MIVIQRPKFQDYSLTKVEILYHIDHPDLSNLSNFQEAYTLLDNASIYPSLSCQHLVLVILTFCSVPTSSLFDLVTEEALSPLCIWCSLSLTIMKLCLQVFISVFTAPTLQTRLGWFHFESFTFVVRWSPTVPPFVSQYIIQRHHSFKLLFVF